MKVPEFMNTSEKWNALVESIDTGAKFDEVALKILDDDDIDFLEFRDIIVKLAADIKCRRPYSGEFITVLTDTVVEMLDFLNKKCEERNRILATKMAEMSQMSEEILK